jgi:hypothetical protein
LNPRHLVLFIRSKHDLRFRRPTAPQNQSVESSSPPLNPSLDTSILVVRSFSEWLQSQGKTKATIKETVNYAKKYWRVLDTGDASRLLTLSPRNKQHAMTAIAYLSKFTGRYDQWLQLRQCYNLKWSKGDSLQVLNRFFDDELNFDTMLQRIKEMMRLLPPLWVRS